MIHQLKNIIFDFGGVLVDLDKERTVTAFQALGIDVSPYIRDYVQGGPFAPLEQGLYTEQEFFQELRKMIQSDGHSVTDEALADAWNQMLVRIPKRRLEALLRLRTRYHTFLLSNTNKIHWDYSEAHLFPLYGNHVTDYFEQIFLSYEMKLMKPDQTIFQKVLQQQHLLPEETLFIDDSEANCAAAQALGIRTYCPKEADDWLPLFI